MIENEADNRKLQHAQNSLLGIGMPPNIVQGLVDFISGRKQRVKSKQTLSTWITLSKWCPWGNNLSSIIFLCIINNHWDKNTKESRVLSDLLMQYNLRYN